MTVYEDENRARRSGVGTKVLALACGILAVLGSFWGIVWFIRAYVEPPRVMTAAGLKLASRDSTLVPTPAPTLAAETRVDETKTAVDPQPAPAPAASAPIGEAPTAPAPVAQAPSAPPPAAAAPRQAPAANGGDQPTGSVADRWAPVNQFAPGQAAPAVPAPPVANAPAANAPATSAPAPSETAPAALATPASDPEIEQVAEGSVPAIDGPAPLPRRRPVMTARRAEPPLPRPRPDGQVAPSSVFTAAPITDDRYPGQ